MEPRIQYAKTSDGVSIAFCVMGEGTPLVMVPPPPLSHAQLAWETWGYLLKPLAQRFRVVWYDSRGSGLSDRDAVDFSMEAMVRDLDAVVAQTALERFALCSIGDGVPIAVTSAAAWPERVSHLILVDGWVKNSDLLQSPQVQFEVAIRDKDWVLYTETFSSTWFGFDSPDVARQVAAYMRECVGPDGLRAAYTAMGGWDISGLMSQVRAPTLVAHNRGGFIPVQHGQRLAGAIPGAHFLVVEDPFYAGVPALVEEFVAPADSAATTPAAGLVTVLFTDIEGSTAMTQRLGDAKAREVLREHERITREALRAHGGSEVKTMGDGFMASFGSAVKALECAIAIQRAFEARNAVRRGGSRTAPTGVEPETIRVRIGLNAGEPIAEDDPDGRGDLFGTAVIRAARIAAMAQGGEILVANVVRELAEGKAFMFGDRGEAALRGFDDPVRLFAVRWQPPSTELRTGFDSPADAGGSG